MSHNIVLFKERFTMKSFLVVAFFVCASYAAIFAHNDDGNLKGHNDNDGPVIEGQFLDLEERAAQCNRGIKKLKIEKEVLNKTPFEIKAKGKFEGWTVCCHRNCPKCGGNNCARKKFNGGMLTDQDKKCCGTKIAEEGKYCRDQEAGRNQGPCILSD